MSDQTNDQTTQTNAADTPGSEAEGLQANQGNTTQTNAGDPTVKIAELLTAQSAILAKLAEKPESVNADGLKHLSDQTRMIVDKLAEIGGGEAGVKQALAQVDSLKLQLARAEIIREFGIAKDDESLLPELSDVTNLRAAAEKLATRLKAAVPKSAFEANAPKVDISKIAPHLRHLAD